MTVPVPQTNKVECCAMLPWKKEGNKAVPEPLGSAVHGSLKL